MPKLSKDTLGKMFPCPHCGEFFRTRQGLSGHIQWKHYFVKKSNYADSDYIKSWGKHFKSVRIPAGIPKSEVDQHIRLVFSWPSVVSILETLKLDASDKDFKYYLLSGLAYMHESYELEERLTKRIRNLFENYESTS